jgi:hypothetical protein
MQHINISNLSDAYACVTRAHFLMFGAYYFLFVEDEKLRLLMNCHFVCLHVCKGWAKILALALRPPCQSYTSDKAQGFPYTGVMVVVWFHVSYCLTIT